MKIQDQTLGIQIDENNLNITKLYQMLNTIESETCSRAPQLNWSWC